MYTYMQWEIRQSSPIVLIQLLCNMVSVLQTVYIY